MRFCDFFIEYKIRLKDVSNGISFGSLPFYRKISTITAIVMALCSTIFFAFNKDVIGIVMYFTAAVILLAVYFEVDSTKKNMKKMLHEHYMPYSQRRMEMLIGLLREKFDSDCIESTCVDSMIQEAKIAQRNCNPFKDISKSAKTVIVIISPPVAYAAKRIADTQKTDDVVVLVCEIIALVIAAFALFTAASSVFREFFGRDYNKYDDLIYDLRQLKIFSCNNNLIRLRHENGHNAVEFYKEFTARVKEDVICDDDKTLFEKYKNNTEFTKVVKEIINRIIDDWTDDGIKYSHQNEYYRIDSVGWISYSQRMRDDAKNVGIKINAHLWDLKIAVEHENSLADWTDELIKLIHIKCPLKVIIGYNYSDERVEEEQRKLDFVAKWMQEIKALNMGEGEEEYLIILGNAHNHKTGKSDYKDFGYMGYLYDWDTKRFKKIEC